MDYIEAQTRYATNVVVVDGYKGVPALKDGYLIDKSGNKFPSDKDAAQFTNVFIIDNQGLRGRQLSTYDATGTIAHRKGARGCVMHTAVNSSGIDFSKMSIVGTEDLYSDLGCNFTASLNTQDSRNSCLSIGMTITQLEFENDAYKYTKKIFDQKRDLELVNINLEDAAVRKMRAFYYTNDAEKLAEGGKSYTYDEITKATSGGGSTDGISDIYSGVNDYTYIFYTRVVTIDSSSSEKFTVNLYAEKGGSTVVDHANVKAGDPIEQKVIDRFVKYGQDHAGKKTIGSKVIITTYDGIISDGNGTIEDYATKGVTSDMDFYVNYITTETNLTPNGEIRFLDIIDNDLKFLGTMGNLSDYTNQLPGGGPTFPAVETEASHTYTAPDASRGASMLEFQGWYYLLNGDGSGVSGTEFDPTQEYYSSMDFYAAYGPYVMFHPMEGGSFISGDTAFPFKKSATGAQVLGSSIYQERLADYISGIPANKELHWDLLDGSGGVIDDLANVTTFTESNYNIQARLEDKAAPGLALSSWTVSENTGWKNAAGATTFSFHINLENSSAEDIKGGKIELIFNDEVGEIVQTQYSNTEKADFTIDDHKVVLDFKRSGENWSKISGNGGTDSFDLTLRPKTPNSSFDLQSLNPISTFAP